jgi:tRNA/rRNA methyltransferase
MAGTNRTRGAAVEAEVGPVIILVQPQLGENIGAAARAMLNFGLTRMRLVRPRDKWPNHQALNTSSGAELVLDQAELFDTTEDAIADLRHVYAATARVRDMVKPVFAPHETAQRLREQGGKGEASGILFGRERSGLDNDDVALAEALLIVPANPAYSSINLAQAVLLLAYEWFQAGAPETLEEITRKGASPATAEELQHLFDHLEGELDACGFLRPPEKRPRMVRNIRNIFTRAELTDQEVRTLRGIITGLKDFGGQNG